MSAAPTSGGQRDTHIHQGAERPTEKPSDEGVEAVRKGKAHMENAALGASGSGHMPPAQGAKPSSEIQTTSSGEGTGEHWVKSSGTAADGGDFDAAKPGAGREADRKFGVAEFVS